MNRAFIERDPTEQEIERFRLILSTYQDGSGQQMASNGQTLPGWRDFERVFALAFNGIGQENKYIFDVLLPDSQRDNSFFGVSCKMRRTLNDTKRLGRVTLELSNSAGAFWGRLKQHDIHQQNYKNQPNDVGRLLLAQVESWHAEANVENGGKIDLLKSFYLALSWNHQGEYQLFKFPLTLPDADSLQWDFPTVYDAPGRRLRGKDQQGTLFEWYGESGGQLKYYPLVENALWKSEIFSLEPLPTHWENQHGILAKARDYFPEIWETLAKK
jgi:hypothetical protein